MFVSSCSAPFQPTIQAHDCMDHVIKDDERWYKDWSLRILHYQVITLKLPYLIYIGLNTGKRVTEKETDRKTMKELVENKFIFLTVCSYLTVPSLANFCIYDLRVL